MYFPTYTKLYLFNSVHIVKFMLTLHQLLYEVDHATVGLHRT